MQPAIRIEKLGKLYRLAAGAPRSGYRTFRETLVEAAAAPLRRLLGRSAAAEPAEEFWALRDVSFEVQPGEVVGVIGRNGAGKSTLLKVLSRITKPTTGRVEINGRVGSLLEVGTGFHPELTGRENIYLNGSILGMSRKEIDRKFDEIVAFAEVEKFLDLPVKRYSSGMYVRLAFAVAAHLEPETLFIDEVLAVGDQQFQKKCLGKLEDVSRQGRTVVFVSHDMAAMNRLTSQCLYLRQGQQVCFKPTREAISSYLYDTSKTHGQEVDVAAYRRGGCRDSTVRLTRFRITDAAGNPVRVVKSGDPFVIEATYIADETLPDGCMAFSIVNELGQRVGTFFSWDQGTAIPLRPGEWVARCEVRGLPFAPGRYVISLGLNQQANTTAFDVLVDVPALEVVLPAIDAGELDWPHRPWGAVHWTDVRWEVSAGEPR
jgi:lipopolysaccharide transport system ATP-binding protein